MNKQYKIAIYTSSFPPKTGGIAAAHYSLYKELGKVHDVQAFVFRDGAKEPGESVIRKTSPTIANGAAKRALRKALGQPMGRKLDNCDAIAETSLSVLKMNSCLSSFSPDLILCPDHFLPALAIRKPPGSKLAWIARHNYLRFAEQIMCPAKDFKDLHLAHRLERRAIQKADVLVSPSEYMLNLANSMFDVTIPGFVARNFVNQDVLNAVHAAPLHEKLSIDRSVPIIYVPSGGCEIKGARYLFEIVRRISAEHTVAVYIPGSINATLKHEIENLCPGCVVYCPGPVEYATNLSNVASCSITVSPTLVENLSNALIESMLLGVPVVTFNTGGNAEIVGKETGAVVGYADVDALIRETCKLLACKGDLAALSSTCKQGISKIVDPQRVVKTYDEILQAT